MRSRQQTIAKPKMRGTEEGGREKDERVYVCASVSTCVWCVGAVEGRAVSLPGNETSRLVGWDWGLGMRDDFLGT